MPSPGRAHRPSAVLGATVFIAGVIGGLASELLWPVTRVLPIGVAAITYLNDALSTIVIALAPLVLIYIACQRSSIQSLPIPVIATASLLAGVIGQWVGIVLGNALIGSRIPSPIVLVTPADIALGQAGLSLLVVLLLGIFTAGLWPMVGTFGGIGLASVTVGPD